MYLILLRFLCSLWGVVDNERHISLYQSLLQNLFLVSVGNCYLSFVSYQVTIGIGLCWRKMNSFGTAASCTKSNHEAEIGVHTRSELIACEPSPQQNSALHGGPGVVGPAG